MAGKPRKKAAEHAVDASAEDAEFVEVAPQPEVAAKAPRKMAVPFDPDEPHATIHGGLTKARYLQDGRYYDAKFKL